MDQIRVVRVRRRKEVLSDESHCVSFDVYFTLLSIEVPYAENASQAIHRGYIHIVLRQCGSHLYWPIWKGDNGKVDRLRK